MRRKIAFLILALFLFNAYSFIFNKQVLATIDIPTGNYGWTLGKYDSKTQTVSPPETTSFRWDISTVNSMWIRTIGPTSVWVDSKKEGTIVSFVDRNSNTDNGYPMVEQSQWQAWINLFGGGSNSAFVLQNLKSWYIAFNGKTFANLSQLAELSGGRGLSYDVATGSIYYGKSDPPTASITPTRYSCKVGESITFNLSARNYALAYQFLDMTFKDDKGTTYVNNKRFLSNIANETVTKTFNAAGNYLFTLVVNDGVFRYNTKQLLISVSDNPVDPVQPPEPPPVIPPEPPEAPNLPPTAVFGLPSYTYEGDTVDVSESSFDLDGEIVDWDWDHEPAFAGSSHLLKGGGELTIETIGKFNITLTVTDDDGATNSVTHFIVVKAAKPEAIIAYQGSLKENRKVTLNSIRSKSSDAYPIDHSRDEWVITPISGGTAADIKLGTRSGANQEVLFKKAGTYRVGLRVHNEKYDSEWVYKDIIIVPDDPPVTNFLRPAITFRNPADSNHASITLNDRTFSLDGDMISQRIWKYKYDSDNDGSFLDEAWAILDSGNNSAPVLRVTKVGKYLVELEAKESFGQPTIPAFITEADYRTGNTSTKPQADKIIDVQNIAPVTSFTATLKPKVDIIFSQGYMTDYYNRFPLMVNNLEAVLGSKLAAKNVDYAFYNTTTAPAPDSGTINKSASSQWSNVTVDLGKAIPIGSITSFTPTWTCPNTIEYRINASENGIDWFNVDRYGYYWGIHWGGHSNLPMNEAKGPPIESIRYVQFASYMGSPGAATLNVSVSYDEKYKRYYGWFIDGKGNYMAGSDVDQGLSNDIRWDLGQELSSSMLRDTYFKFWFQTIGGDEDSPLPHLFVTAQASLDNVNWTTISTNTFTGDKWGNLGTQFVYPANASYPAKFRFYRLLFSGDSGYSMFFRDAGLFINYTEDTTPHATLADIKAKAEQTYRSDATKVIVSLAEEPYTDSNAASLTNTANSLISNKAYFVALANAGSIPSVQQLTSKLTKQTIITTTADMSVPLSQLADHINSNVVAAPLSGIIYLLLGQSVGYNPSYSDYENDPKVTDNWNYVHDAGYVDNNAGVSFYHNKVLSGPVANLDKVGKYDVQYKAQDDPANNDLRFLNYRMWSDPAPTNIIIHRKPIANFSVQAGTVNVTDLSYDPDFQFRRPDKGIVEWLWKWRKTTDVNWTNGKPSGITAVGDYVVHLEVKDVYGAWSDPVEKTITVASLQKPPVANFTWTPTLIYEGDTVTLTNLSTDPDGGPLTYLWTVFNPLGATTTFTTKNGSLTNVLPGTYWITLRATDPGGMSDVVTKSFVVGTLGITGYVNHTPDWNKHRILYNQYHTGTDDSPRAYNTFWAGENIILQATTTDTGVSATKPVAVSANFISKGVTTNLSFTNPGKTSWTGEMWQQNFQNIPDGVYTFRFTVTYSNGVVKTDDVPININGSIFDYFQLHRTH
jgi:hypothetical protein